MQNVPFRLGSSGSCLACSPGERPERVLDGLRAFLMEQNEITARTLGAEPPAEVSPAAE